MNGLEPPVSVQAELGGRCSNDWVVDVHPESQGKTVTSTRSLLWPSSDSEVDNSLTFLQFVHVFLG